MKSRSADIYAQPTLRPCAAIPAETTDGLRVGLQDRYDALTRPLPLKGGGAMGPGSDFGVLLSDRLRSSLPWMEPAIAAIERQLKVAVWAGRPWLEWRPLCLVGEPGVGKSHFAREIGRLSETSCAVLDLGAMHDAAALVPVSRGWTNAKPCWPAEMMASFECANPILVLDEIEKAGGSRRNGDPQKALLAMLEPSTAAAYFDTCLMTNVDLSAICWIATANSTDGLMRPLASRLDIVHVEGPQVEHFDVLVRNVVADLIARWQVVPSSIPEVPTRARKVLREAFARHRSVRTLKRHLEAVLAMTIPDRRDGLH